MLLRIESGWSPVCEPREPGGAEWGVLGLGAVTSGTFLANEAKRLPSSLPPRESLEVKPNDVLVARANGSKRLVGVGVVVPENARGRLIFPDLVYRLIPDPGMLDPRYLGVIVAAPAFRRQVESAMRSTSGQFKISKADLGEFVVPVPALVEQRRVVEVLDALVEKERAIEAALLKLEFVEEGMLQDAFGSRNPVGVVSDLGVVVTGATPPPDWDSSTLEGGIPLFTPSQVRDAEGSLSDPERSIARYRAGDLRMVPAGSTLAVCIGFGAGKVALSAVESCTNQQINAVIPYQGFDHRFVYLAVRSAMRRAKSLLNLQVTPIINKTDFSQLPVDLPSEAEQKRIVEQIWAVRMKKSALVAEKVKLGRLRAGLSGDLLPVV
ncbi:restriction endonuclease subunit S [Streptomyces sp. NPDC046197]|uniref:restriction endonuclease subunit S n=1 Tax=Streptomyces sp. NPDC046197 TaxID=3154337 RepID=UPI0033C66C57